MADPGAAGNREITNAAAIITPRPVADRDEV
jgi:hypothetical protein